MNKLYIFFTFIIFSLSLSAQGRSIDLGIIDYFSKYDYSNMKRLERSNKAFESFFSQIKKLAPAIKIHKTDVDIFLQANKAERDKYKRIMIPYQADWFTMEMYEGMMDYVKSGGLLITQSALLLLDKNNNYMNDEYDTTNFARRNITGVEASGGAYIGEIKAELHNPLTKGLPLSETLKLEKTLFGRETKNIVAKVAVSDEQENKNGPKKGVLLSYKSTGKGACVYLSVAYEPEAKQMPLIMKNILSEETLNWLCIQK